MTVIKPWDMILVFFYLFFFALAATYDWVYGNCTNISLSWGLTYFANDDIILSMPRTDDLELVLRSVVLRANLRWLFKTETLSNAYLTDFELAWNCSNLFRVWDWHLISQLLMTPTVKSVVRTDCLHLINMSLFYCHITIWFEYVWFTCKVVSNVKWPV